MFAHYVCIVIVFAIGEINILLLTNQVSPVVLASIFQDAESFFRLLQLVVNTEHTNRPSGKVIYRTLSGSNKFVSVM